MWKSNMLAKKENAQCSFCSSEDVKKISSFGTAQLVRQYYCNECKSVFEYIRWQKEEAAK
ncbi:PaaD-like zinc ribbon domain-containing protein [Ferdinandcohnia sp. SAFN-114]|uniref:PaaD-like zinc ribbon domain-containing protein n=1 Tax=unclassified Fredinandcohnia TaxID=2837514 RepID=UPI003F7EA602